MWRWSKQKKAATRLMRGFTQQSRAPFQTGIRFGSCGVGEKPIINHRGMWTRIAAETTDVAGFRSREDGEEGQVQVGGTGQ